MRSQDRTHSGAWAVAPERRAHSRRRTALRLLAVVLLALAQVAIGVSVRGSAPALAGSSGASLDQCANKGTVCDTNNPSQWVNGNVNSSKATYLEGDSLPYRATLTGLTTGLTYTLTLQWDTTKGGKHALDYLTTYNRTVASADPCAGLTCGGPTSTLAIPNDPNVTGAGVTPVPNSVFTLFGGTFPSGALTSYTLSGLYSGDSSTSISVTFIAGNATAVLAWGGHIASRFDWPTGSSAAYISGSPYHMYLNAFTCAAGGCSTGAQDRALASDAVILPGAIAIVKSASPQGPTAFPFTASPSPLGDFSLVDNTTTGPITNTKTFGGITTFTAYTITEDATAGWTLNSIVCLATYPNGGTASISGTTATINLKEGENWTCTYSNGANATPTATATGTSTATPTNTPSATNTATPTNTSTPTATNTSTPVPTGTSTPTSTATDTPTATATATDTFTPAPTDTGTALPTDTATNTAIPTNTSTATPTGTFTSVPTGTSTPTSTATDTPTATATSTSTNTPVPNTTTPTSTATATDTFTPTNVPVVNTDTPTSTATNTATATATATSTTPPNNPPYVPPYIPPFIPSSTPTTVPTSTDTPVATSTATPADTATASATDTPVPPATSTSTVVPPATSTDTPANTATDTETPVPAATSTGTAVPTDTPPAVATDTDTPAPTDTQAPAATATDTSTPVAKLKATAGVTIVKAPTSTPTRTPKPRPTQAPLQLATATPVDIVAQQAASPTPAGSGVEEVASATSTPLPKAQAAAPRASDAAATPTAVVTATSIPSATAVPSPTPIAYVVPRALPRTGDGGSTGSSPWLALTLGALAAAASAGIALLPRRLPRRR